MVFVLPNLSELYTISKKSKLNLLDNHLTRRQTGPGGPKSNDPARAQSLSTVHAQVGCNGDMKTSDMKLPVELWREIIREAGTIQDEFEGPPFIGEVMGDPKPGSM
jgi:hypothetical protein